MWLFALLSLVGFADGPSRINSDEVVVFYPTCASRSAGGEGWQVPIRGVIFEPEENSIRRRGAISLLQESAGFAGTEFENEVCRVRLRHFLVDHESGKAVSIRLGDQTYPLGESDDEGRIDKVLQLSDVAVRSLRADANAAEGWVTFEAVMRDGDERKMTGRVQFIDPAGLSVISDIDDTIKETCVTNRREMMLNTFTRPFKPVEGMPELYRQIHVLGATVHYVSCSPWQLYEPLADFSRQERFPNGSIHLRDLTVSEIHTLGDDKLQREIKLRNIESLLKSYLQRKFILIGDSGEQDPEVYGDVARRFGGQIVGIFIRTVDGAANNPARFQSAFRRLDVGVWKTFDRPEELNDDLVRLCREHAMPN